MNAELDPAVPKRGAEDIEAPGEEAPDWLLDTQRMRQPRLGPVIDALDDVDDGETVVVITPISPVPLYDHLDDRGWGYETERISPNEWHIRITAADCGGDSGERLRRQRLR
ncbi:DUF2249 domain-containing protein [Natronomonas amylolytica]|uniref:DUF2249 domain-containing protein n=1 Tax=Natronomonas amylolytica TaxID=3108498 RepID=UPI00300AD9C0